MFCSVKSGIVYGIDGKLVSVEVDVSDGLPCFHLVGLLASEVKEAGERVRNALRNSGYRLNAKRVTINLSPADIRKSGTAFDVAIAVAMLCSYGVISQEKINNIIFLGELGLGGEIKAVKGILPIIDAAMEEGFRTFVVPVDNVREGDLVKNACVIGVHCFKDVVQYVLKGIVVHSEKGTLCEQEKQRLDFADIKGQRALIRSITIAASGMHNILVAGPPGTGKSMVAKRIPGILPELTYDEKMIITKIYSAAGLLKDNKRLLSARPFRSPHHTITKQALIGGGAVPKPGEITLAHGGVLFLDELPEFSKGVIEVLRQPLEDRKITLSKVYGNFQFPADFMLVAAMNLCPCGRYPDKQRCICSVADRKRYLSKISQPILDRMDMQVLVSPVDFSAMYGEEASVTSEDIRCVVSRAYKLQRERYSGTDIIFNSQLEGKYIEQFCGMTPECKGILKSANDKFQLSVRANNRVRKLARTIADVENSDIILESHLLEALSYRGLEDL